MFLGNFLTWFFFLFGHFETVFPIVNTIVQFSKIVLKGTVLSFSKNDYQLHENWQLAAVLAGLQGRGSTREKEGNVIQQIFFCATATTLSHCALLLLFWLKNGGRHSSVEISFRSSEHKLCNKTFKEYMTLNFVGWL